MTGSVYPEVNHVMTLWNVNPRVKNAAAIKAQALTTIQQSPDIADKMREEIARIEGTAGRRALLDVDEVSRLIRGYMKDILAAYEALPPAEPS